MKAEERHRLKTNELAQSLSQIPQYISKHSNQILTIALIVLVITVGGLWAYRSWAGGKQKRFEQLNLQLMRTTRMQMEALNQAFAQTQPTGEPPPPASPYDADAVASVLGNLSEESPGTPVAKTALLQQAEVIRSALFFSEQDITDEQKSQMLEQIKGIYELIRQQYPDDALAQGTAQMGLALVAEEQEQWDQASKIYEEVIAAGQGNLAGTVYPLLARRRLDIMENFTTPIVFPLTPPVPEFDLSSLPTAPDEELPWLDPNIFPAAAAPETVEPPVAPKPAEALLPDPNKIEQTTQPLITDPNKASVIPVDKDKIKN